MIASFWAGLLAGLTVLQMVGIAAGWPGLTIAGGRGPLAFVPLGIALAATAALVAASVLAPGAWAAIPGALLAFPAQLALAAATALPPAEGFGPPAATHGEAQSATDVHIAVRLPEVFPHAAGVARWGALNRDWGSDFHPNGDHALGMPGTLFAPPDRPAGAVLLVCGAGDNRRSFKGPLIRALVARGLAVLTIDPPGHGDFQSVPASLPNLQAGVGAAFAWLGGRFPGAQVGAAGISLGGCQVAWLAATTPAVAAVALISTPVSLAPIGRATYLREFCALGLPGNWPGLRYGTIRALWREWKSMPGYVAGSDSLYTLIDRFGLYERALDLRGRPVLVVHGRSDAAVPIANAEVLAAACGGALLPVPMANHLSVTVLPHIAAQIADWFGARLAPPGPAAAPTPV